MDGFTETQLNFVEQIHADRRAEAAANRLVVHRRRQPTRQQAGAPGGWFGQLVGRLVGRLVILTPAARP
jgi:hypothetical protein